MFCFDADGKLLHVGRWKTFVSVFPMKISALEELLEEELPEEEPLEELPLEEEPFDEEPPEVIPEPEPVPASDAEPVPESRATPPKTGDISSLWAAVSAISLGGIALLNKKRKK